MLRADAMVSSHQPSRQIREGDVDHREVAISFLAIAIAHHGLVRAPQLGQIVVAAPSVGAHPGARDYALLHEPRERFGPAVWHETQAQPSCVNGSVGCLPSTPSGRGRTSMAPAPID